VLLLVLFCTITRTLVLQALLAGAVWPFVVLLIGELVKKRDARIHSRYMTLQRLEFNTRLGMHSPR
jgi:hypothetical protein